MHYCFITVITVYFISTHNNFHCNQTDVSNAKYWSRRRSRRNKTKKDFKYKIQYFDSSPWLLRPTPICKVNVSSLFIVSPHFTYIRRLRLTNLLKYLKCFTNLTYSREGAILLKFWHKLKRDGQYFIRIMSVHLHAAGVILFASVSLNIYNKSNANSMCSVVNNRSGAWQWVVGQSYACDLHRVDTDRRDHPHKPGLVALSRLHFSGRYKLSGWRFCACAINVNPSMCSETQSIYHINTTGCLLTLLWLLLWRVA